MAFCYCFYLLCLRDNSCRREEARGEAELVEEGKKEEALGPDPQEMQGEEMQVYMESPLWLTSSLSLHGGFEICRCKECVPRALCTERASRQ